MESTRSLTARSRRGRNSAKNLDIPKLAKEIIEGMRKQCEEAVTPGMHPSDDNSHKSKIRWRGSVPEPVNIAETYDLEVKSNRRLTLQKYHKRMLVYLLDNDMPTYYELCEYASGKKNCKDLDSHRWHRVSRSVMQLWVHGFVKTVKAVHVTLTVDGWVVATALRNGTWET